MDKTELTTERQYTTEETIKAVVALPEEEQDILLSLMKVPELTNLLNDKENFETYCKNLLDYVATCKRLEEILRKVGNSMDTVLNNEVKEFSEEYDNLPEDKRKKVVLELMNNPDFQRNCCDILVKDYERVANENPTVKALDNLLGLGKYYKKCIETGFGCDHKYEVDV